MPDKSLHISTANQIKFAKAVRLETSTNKKPGGRSAKSLNKGAVKTLPYTSFCEGLC
jgi:hypothetical protein